MKTGKTLQELAAELDRQKDTRKDYLVKQGAMDVKVVDGEVVVDGINGTPMTLTENAHDQFSAKLSIPKPYYDRMRREQPALLADNVRTWLSANPDEKRMLRALDGRIRANLSPKYNPIDNYDVMAAVMPTLLRLNAQVVSAELTERRMYIKAILPGLSDELPEGMTWGEGHHIFGPTDRRVVAAVVLANSDVGASTFRIEPSTYIAYCTNLAIMAAAAMKKYHVGRAFDSEADSYEVYRDATRRASDKAFFMKVQDITAAAFEPDTFKAAVASIKDAYQKKIESRDLSAVVDAAVEELSLPPTTKSNVLTWLAQGGDLSAYGLSSAITRTAQDVDDYEVATDLERAGGKVLALPDATWNKIAKAA